MKTRLSLNVHILLLLSSFFFMKPVLADYIFSPGIGATSAFQSDEKSSSDKVLLDANTGIGLLGSVEWKVMKPLSIGLGIGYSSFSAKSEVENDQGSATKLSTAGTLLNLDLGARLRFINFALFKVFVGGGVTYGKMSLTFDQDEYESQNSGSDAGLKANEFKSYEGSYLDAGVEFIFSNRSGIRLSAKRTNASTDKFQSMNNKKLHMNYFNYALQYMFYVN